MIGRSSLQRLARRIGILCSGIAAFWLLLLASGLTLPMASLQHPVEVAAARALGQQVEITGGVNIRPTVGPTLVMFGLQVHLAGSPGEGGRLRAERVQARLGLLSLLQGRPRIVALEVQGIRLELDAGEEGLRAGLRALWPTAVGQSTPLQARRGLEYLAMRDLQVSWRSVVNGQVFQVRLDELSGSVLPARPLDLKVRGRLRQQPFVARIGADPVEKLLAPAGAWRMRGTLKYAGANLKLTSLVDLPLHGPLPGLEFDLHGGRLPLVDVARIHGRVDLDDSGARLSGLAGTVGKTQLTGSGSLELAGARPHLRLDVTVPVLDAGDLRGYAYRDILAALFETAAAATMPPSLQAMAIDATVLILSVAHARVPVEDVSMAIRVQDGDVTIPLGINIAGIMLHGNLLSEAQGEVPGARLVLSAAQVDAAGPAAALTGYRGIRGQVGEVEVQAVAATAPGDGGIALVAELRLDDAEFSYGNLPGQQPVAVTVDRLRLHIPQAKAITASVQGRLLDLPVDLTLGGGVLKDLLQGREWPVTLAATGAGARLAVQGEVVAARGNLHTRLNAELSGNRLGSLAPWLGVSPCAEATYRMRGQFIIARDTGRLQFVQARLGDTRLNADLDWTRDEEVPVIHAVMQFDEVVPGDLKGALRFVRLEGPAAEAVGLTLEIPVLPASLKIRNADIRLNIAHIDMGLVNISNLKLVSAIQDARLQSSPFAVDIGNTRYEGYLEPSQGYTGMVWSVAESDAVAGSLLNRLFSNALQWVGHTGRIPLRSLFSNMLEAGDCGAEDDRVTEP
jgi:hypothetical protein